MKRAFLFLSMVAALCACNNRTNKAESTEEAANTNSPKFAKLLKEGVRSFFSEEKPLSDEELLEYLFAEEVSALNNLPLPGNAPYLSETGVVFCYTQYEIAPYSSGIITFEVPFKHITPFLTEEAKSMIPRQ